MLNRWYHSLNDREKLLMATGGCIAILLLLFLLLWRPLVANNQQLERSLARKSQQLTEMQLQVEEINQLRQKGAGSVTAGSLQQRVTQSAATLKISLTRLQSSNDQTLQLWLDRIEFNSLLNLIAQLSQQGVSVEKLNLQPLPESGYSKARLTLAEL